SRIARALALLAALCAAGSLAGCRRVLARLHRHRVVAPVTPRLSPARVARGRGLYLRYCSLCHRPAGTGYAADHAHPIGNADFLHVASDAFLRAAIHDGRPGTPMSAWAMSRGGPLDDAMIDDIVTYVRSLARRRYIDVGRVQIHGSSEAGAVIWQQRCQS